MGKELTVIIPSYNMELFLPKCLESFGIDQLRKEDTALADALEVIVVNDGSVDRTSELAHQFDERFPEAVKVIDKANGGYGSCVNAALRLAAGRYVRVLDADDYLLTTMTKSRFLARCPRSFGTACLRTACLQRDF